MIFWTTNAKGGLVLPKNRIKQKSFTALLKRLLSLNAKYYTMDRINDGKKIHRENLV